ncbi:hypothetical protein Q6321_28735, partial [Klebsiella pneumoniae]
MTDSLQPAIASEVPPPQPIQEALTLRVIKHLQQRIQRAGIREADQERLPLMVHSFHLVLEVRDWIKSR